MKKIKKCFLLLAIGAVFCLTFALVSIIGSSETNIVMALDKGCTSINYCAEMPESETDNFELMGGGCSSSPYSGWSLNRIRMPQVWPITEGALWVA